MARSRTRRPRTPRSKVRSRSVIHDACSALLVEFGTSVALSPASEASSVARANHQFSRIPVMLWTLAVILLILWALGFLAFHVGGGLIHLLLVIALIVIVYRLVTGRRPVA